MTHMFSKKLALHTILALTALSATHHQAWSAEAKQAASPKRELKRPKSNPQLTVHIPAKPSDEPSSAESTPQSSTASSPVHVTSPTRMALDGSRVVIGGSSPTSSRPSAQTVSAPSSPVAGVVTRKRSPSAPTDSPALCRPAMGGSPTVAASNAHGPGGSPVARPNLDRPVTPPARQHAIEQPLAHAVVRGRVGQAQSELERACTVLWNLEEKNLTHAHQYCASQQALARASRHPKKKLALASATCVASIWGLRRTNTLLFAGACLAGALASIAGLVHVLYAKLVGRYKEQQADACYHARETLSPIRHNIGHIDGHLLSQYDTASTKALDDLKTTLANENSNRRDAIVRYVQQQIALARNEIASPALD